ncbi:MAG TPA: hypothetical protein VFU19_09810 [Iamia sp.]|nr:hypothetical protein [Iamia sp.]
MPGAALPATAAARPGHPRRSRRPAPAPEWDAEGRWNPWAALRARPHVELRLDPEAGLLGGGMLVLGPGLAVVVIDPALDRRSRRVALAHELIHEERGGGCDAPGLPEALDVIVARDEAEVVREVARRLVPAPALRRLLEQRHGLGLHVEPWEVAEAFDVDDATARVALAELGARTRRAA